MSRPWIERGLWLTAVVATLAAIGVLWNGAAAEPGSALPVLPVVMLASPRPTVDSLEEAVSDVAERNLFRPDRSMAEARNEQPAVGSAMTAPFTPRPRLTLRGILGGPPWDALIEGIPGRDGALVLRAGQTMAGVTIKSIRRDTVLVKGFDTTWTLTLARSW